MADVFAKSSLKGGASLVALGLMLGSSAAFAGGLPHGGHYVAGHGTLNKATQSLTVKQSSIAGIIDWKGFSVGKHGSVTFDNGSGATLNRVTGGNLSRIAGTLHATGSLYLINSSGVIVSGTGRVITGGAFVASSSTLSNSDFDSHERRFGDADAKAINRGSITSGGEAKLVGISVANTGTITGAHVKLRATEGDSLAAGTIRATGNAHHDAHILVISDTGETRIAGALIAHNRDGSGGSVETSGRKLSIGGRIDAGKGGSWLVDPENLTVGAKSAKTIDKALDAGTNVTLQTTTTSTSGPGTTSSGPGDIVIASPLSWKTTAALTLDAYRSVVVAAAVNVASQGSVSIGAQHGSLSFDGGNMTFADVASSLTINNKKYTLVADIATLAHDISLHHGARYALANNYDASADGTYTSSPINTRFTGVFEGLGNTISNLKIRQGAADNSISLGLFAQTRAGAIIRNVSLTNLSVTSDQAQFVGGLLGNNVGSTLRNDFVDGSIVTGDPGTLQSATGLLVGFSEEGTIADSNATGRITGSFAFAGGLVGYANGGQQSQLSASWANVIVDTTKGTSGDGSAAVGGLIGNNIGVIKDSYAIGDVTGRGAVGGLVGEQNGTIDQSYATGAVLGKGGQFNPDAGGLVGMSTGTITHSYATGNVAVSAVGMLAGGLAGEISNGEISESYATGDVSQTKSATWQSSGLGGFAGSIDGDSSNTKVKTSYATGSVNSQAGADAGGFAGISSGGIENAYATGAVDVTHGGREADVGGFVGSMDGTIKDAYSTGAVTVGSKHDPFIGGFVGINEETKNVGLTHCYWDTETSGMAATPYGATGVTTAQLTNSLLPGLSSSVWGLSSDINNGFPYLIALASSY